MTDTPKTHNASTAPKGASVVNEQKTDWDKVQELYRVGVASLRNIAADNHCTEGAIRKRAKKEQWPRDLKAKVRAKAEELVRKTEVRKTVRKGQVVTEAMQISVAATLQADIIIRHRQDIPAARSLVSKMFKELELQTDGIELLKQLGVLMYSPDDKGVDKLNDLYNKVISLSGRSGTLKSLVDSLKVMIHLEREAFGLDDESKDEDMSTPTMSDAELAVRIASLLEDANG